MKVVINAVLDIDEPSEPPINANLIRVTEDGEQRVTEENEIRIIE